MATGSGAQQTFFPANVPLAARSTYMSSWVSTQAGSVYSHTWPTTSIGPFAILGWGGLVKIDNTTYSWLGNPQNGATTNVSQFSVTPTRTVFTLSAPPMELNITFLSPIEPGDLVKQSIPFSYVTFEATSLDGASHSVEVYADLSGEWISGDRGQTISWTTNSGTSNLYHAATLENPQVFGNNNGQAQWGTLYHAAKKDSTTTWRIGSDVVTRGQFANQSVLDNGEDTNFRAINDAWPVFAISKKLGTIQSTASPVVWAVGFARDPAVMYTDVSGTQQQRHLYYQSNYSDISTLIGDFLDDFPAALQRADALDAKLLNAAAALIPGSEYSDLLSISTRQVYASTELTIATKADGSFDTSDVMMFMRDTGAGNSEYIRPFVVSYALMLTGVFRRTNAVEILYAAFPTFMYIDPPLGGALLEPLLRLQNTSDFVLPYAAMDLTSAYPNVTVSASPHNQGVEQSGNMIIMAYAYSRASGDGSLIGRYYTLLKKWSDYLVNNTLTLPNQISSDNTVTTNQTNLAIKGIIAIQAMSSISSTLGRTVEANAYSASTLTLYSNWTSLALASGGQTLLAAYGHQSTWSLGYNLFADRWLGTDVVNSTIFAAQGSSLQNLLQTSGSTNFGLGVDSTSTTIVTSSWNMFAAAMTNDSDARSALVTRIHNRASLNTSSGAFPLTWESQQGSATTGVAR
ncbi:hypothetical protein OF83DRAFT_1071921 [Amylostereum chailletii]|nr:hypothetical protein OF83DRAFT_1071921 [Amylostereum chailletii]